MARNIPEVATSEASILIEWVRFSWSEYLRWFAFLCTLDVAALGALHYVDPDYWIWLESSFVIFNFGGFLTSIAVFLHSYGAFKRAKAITARLRWTPGLGFRGETAASPAAHIPIALGAWCAFASFCAMFAFTVIWAILLNSALRLTGPPDQLRYLSAAPVPTPMKPNVVLHQQSLGHGRPK